MRLIFHETAWQDYCYWQVQDKKILKKLNTLIKDCQRSPFSGIGQPEPLKHHWSGFWSRRITNEHRLVYGVDGDDLLIAQCRFHYD